MEKKCAFDSKYSWFVPKMDRNIDFEEKRQLFHWK
jgi:hypothetical protein